MNTPDVHNKREWEAYGLGFLAAVIERLQEYVPEDEVNRIFNSLKTGG